MAFERPTLVHLDPLGGLAGDMFIAALLDAWPALEGTLGEAVAGMGLPPGWGVLHSRQKRASIEGRHFDVVNAQGSQGHGGHHHDHDSGRYADIARRIDTMPLTVGARGHAQAIYRQLAECEAAVHGIAVAEVHFHELADWDSVVDIVGAGVLIDALGSPLWSVGKVPLGAGRVRTAHGPLPVPAPATTRLLASFEVIDDGIAGERVTPTGAAILAHLAPSNGRQGLRARLGVTGIGVGTRELDGIANMLRVVAFHEDEETHAGEGGGGALRSDSVGVVSFDIDDQSPEDSATGLDRVRECAGVIDVISSQGVGKKGRHVFAVRVLCEPTRLREVELACLAQTASLGVRSQVMARKILARRMRESPEGVAVKVAARPHGATSAKAEHDHVAARAGDFASRRAHAAAAEASALTGRMESDDD